MRKAGSRDPRGEFPADWRERAIGILTSEGVTCPAPTPRWRLLASDLAELAGLSISPVAFLLVAALTADAARRLYFPDAVGKAAELLVVLMFVGLPVIVIFVLWPRAQNITRRIRMDWHIGRDPIHALRTAKRPPVLYLRSFSFDEVSSKPPKWVQFLYTLWAGGAGYPTPELSLVLAVSRFAPVLAVGRPGQAGVSIGALRFHMKAHLSYGGHAARGRARR